jgi:AhpC/TSA family
MGKPITLLYGDQVAAVEEALVRDRDLWLSAPALLSATGWEVKPEGVCQGPICVPVSDTQRSTLLSRQDGTDWFDLSAFARIVEQPVARDEAAETWSFGPPAWEWKSRAADRAPDFTLSDLSGQTHSLSELLGKKVLLLFWASW